MWRNSQFDWFYLNGQKGKIFLMIRKIKDNSHNTWNCNHFSRKSQGKKGVDASCSKEVFAVDVCSLLMEGVLKWCCFS